MWLLIHALNSCSGSDKMPVKLEYEWVIASHIELWMQLLTHAIIVGNFRQYTGPQSVVSLPFRELSNIISQKFTMSEITFTMIQIENFKPKLCMCIQRMALGTRTKFQHEILISMISANHKFRENISDISQNVIETTPWT